VAGLIDRIGSLSGTELGKAVDLGHRFYQERMGVHNHMGRAIIETAAEVARNHPNLVGIGVGLLVEQFLAEQKRRHDVYLAELEGEAEAGSPKLSPPSTSTPRPGAQEPQQGFHVPLVHHDLIQLHALRPGRIAFEVFGALVLLKLASAGIRWFQHDKGHAVWFGPAAKIRLWSGTFAAYYLVKSLKSPRISAWRNAAVALFATDALKPVLKAPKRRRNSKQPSRPAVTALSQPAAPIAGAAVSPPPPVPVPEASMPSAEPQPAVSGTTHDATAQPAQAADAPSLH
jgi:hypothetical protein